MFACSQETLKQIKRFRFDQKPLSLNNFQESDFSDPDLCNDFLFVLFSHIQEKTLDPTLLNQENLYSLVKSRNNQKACHFFHIMTPDMIKVTQFLNTVYNLDPFIFTGNIHDTDNYKQLTHYLSDYIFRKTTFNVNDDIILKAWLVHIIYNLHKQFPDKEKKSDLYFLTQLFFEQTLFSQYNDAYNNIILDKTEFSFLTQSQHKLSLAEYFMIAREDLYYDNLLNKEKYIPSRALCDYLSIIKHSVNHTETHIFIEQHILQSKVAHLQKVAYSTDRL